MIKSFQPLENDRVKFHGKFNLKVNTLFSFDIGYSTFDIENTG
ncbi:hypothetical protein ACFL03_09365 [Thermodesulfobacteriota bacterium]